MRRFSPTSFVVAATLIYSCSTASHPVVPMTPYSGHGFDPASLDKSQPACTDFFNYAAGGWIANHPIPPTNAEWGTITLLVVDNRETLRQIVEEAASRNDLPAGSNERKIGDFYSSCMSEESINRAGVAPLGNELHCIRSVHDLDALAREIGLLQSEGVDAAFDVSSAPDARNSSRVILEISQGGLGLPDRDYYFKSDEKSKTIRDHYVAHMARMFELAGDEPALASKSAAAVLSLETRLAGASMTTVQTRDPEATANWMTLQQLREVMPAFRWDAWFDAIGLAPPDGLNIAQPQFLRAVDHEMSGTSVDDWKTYLRWQLLHRSAPALSAALVDETFDFYDRALTGATENSPRWTRCVRATSSALSEALGELYVRKRFSAGAREHAQQMVGNIIDAFRTRIDALDWMDSTTRARAREKLEALARKVGYPDTWRDYSALVVERGPYVVNDLRATQFDFRQDLAKVGRPADQTVWRMSAQVPNASYVAARNEIVIPAAVLQPPLYDPEADDAYNYGGIGALIGHELTHGFDDRGAKYDAHGDLKNWWSPQALAEFHTRAGCLIDQFSSFTVDGGIHVDGRLVLGESVADLGGVTIAYDAFEKSLQGKPRVVIDGLTPEQRFFLGWARIWTVNIRPEQARLRATTDFHPLGRFRVNGPLSNMPAFAKAYGCKAGDAMVRAGNQRCDLW